MSGNLSKYVDQALEQELAVKRITLAEIEAECIQQELTLATFKSELEHFRCHYWSIVAPLYARLDELSSYIAAYGATADLDDPLAQKAAEEARRRSEESAREASRKFEFEEGVFEASDELRLFYKRAAQMIHPDRASDEDDRAIRNDLMVKLNVAYSHKDQEAISRLIEAYKNGRNAEVKLVPSEELKLLVKQILQMKQRLVDIGKEQQGLMSSDLGKLKRDVDAGEDRGLDPIGDLVANLEAKIAEASKQLESLSGKMSSPIAETITASDKPIENSPPQHDYGASPVKPDQLIHTTARGEKVRSKSEVIIANMLHQLDVDYKYEYPVEGKVGIKRPDFMVFDKAGKMLLWEHLGMLSVPAYKESWDRKLEWYKDNGFIESENLFITTDAPDGSFDTTEVQLVAEQLLARL